VGWGKWWSWTLALIAYGFVSPAAAFELFRNGDGTPSVISPAITAEPVRVLLWVRDTVSADDEAWVTGVIQDAFNLWASVPTAKIGFLFRSVQSATAPVRAPEELLVVVANFADLTTGGSFPPAGGLPGSWLGASADWRERCRPPCNPFPLIAAHEIGHTLVFLHTTVSDVAFSPTFRFPSCTSPFATGCR